jgi:hypothetical protein
MSDESQIPPFVLNQVGDTQHDLLHTVCRHLPTDYEPYGKRERNAADCSCGCKHFLTFAPPLGFDWGVCINPRSPRSGLLTFEHQGCEFFEEAEEGSKDKEFVAELRKRTPSKLKEKKSQT